eukprot:TRINITY_DN2283_c0_g1_i7.p1 TRINITY_DN2283_c0_g1~~TRINITY_DN2283_c0_g1_i7.p1  ORF type:complete len:137 (-),score=6.05 TRINITY_DN2283_c0_g1_i7:257-667(-)
MFAVFFSLIYLCAAVPDKPVYPQSFMAPNQITAFDENSEPHIHKSVMYYDWDFKGERHDHFGYCYGWGNDDCTILIIGNVYIIKEDLCCIAMPGNGAVFPHWLDSATWLGEEVINEQRVNHWYSVWTYPTLFSQDR